MKLFKPARVFFETDSLNYPLGDSIHKYCTEQGIPVQVIGSHNRVTGIPGNTPQQCYLEGKRTLVVGVKRDLTFDSCKPSADYQFALGTSCPGQCQYCYLQTHLGKKPYIRVYVNLDAIFEAIQALITRNLPKTITFEAASTSDPLALEHITGSLAKTIAFFGNLSHAQLRVVSKFDNVAPVLNIPHHQHTKFRFSLNAASVIRNYEPCTASVTERIQAAVKIARAGYPLGFIIAPLMIFPGYGPEYATLFRELSAALQPVPEGLSFELITHRFTASAKKVILERFPATTLDLDESLRRRKFGRYGLAKYIYAPEAYTELQDTILKQIQRYFPHATVEYFT